VRAPWEPSPFKLMSVEKTDVPQGGADQTWYRYVLDNGRSQIRGSHCGSLKSVTEYATQYAAELTPARSPGHSAWAPRTRKPTTRKLGNRLIARRSN